MKSYVSKIQDLEGELLRLKNSNNTKSSRFVDWVDLDDNGFQSRNAIFACGNEYSSDCDAKAEEIPGSILEFVFDYVLLHSISFN